MCPITILGGDPIPLFKAKRRTPVPALYPRTFLKLGPNPIGIFIVRALRRLRETGDDTASIQIDKA